MNTKTLLTSLALGGGVLGMSASANAVDILTEDFETDGNGTRYITSIEEFTDGAGDYFLRTDGSDIGGFVEYTDQDGFYFGAQDIDGEGAESRQTLTFSGIDISNFQNLSLSMDVAEDDEGDNEDFDPADLVHASFVLDGVAPESYETGYAIWFDSDPTLGTGGTSGTLNAPLFENFDFDADGGDSPEDSEVTDTFQTFSRDLGFDGTDASIVDLVLTFDLNSGDEDIAVDNIALTGDVIPEPASVALLGLGGLAMLGRRNRKA